MWYAIHVNSIVVLLASYQHSKANIGWFTRTSASHADQQAASHSGPSINIIKYTICCWIFQQGWSISLFHSSLHIYAFYPYIHAYTYIQHCVCLKPQSFSNSYIIVFALFPIDCPVHLSQEHFPVLKTMGTRIIKNVSNIEFILFVFYLSFCEG